MKRITVLFSMGLALALFVAGCDKSDDDAAPVVAMKIEGYKANLPPVPSIPEPSVPETYGDGSYSIYGVRKNVGKTIGTVVDITAYVVDIYQKPECEEGKTCHTMMPHLWLADEQDEQLTKRRLRLVGYAQNFAEMEDARADAEAGKPQEENDEFIGLPPVIWDWREGHKYKIKGAFVHRSSAGFMDKDGVLEFKDYECLDCPDEEE